MEKIAKYIDKINRIGWRNVPRAILYKIDILRLHLHRQWILRNPLIPHLIPFSKPPFLLLSYPRSGSTWIGSILATSDSVAYLFEPVTRPYQDFLGGTALADLRDPKTYQAYCDYSKDAFQGMPSRNKYPAENLRGFSLMGRRKRRLLIKEVNPRAADFYCRIYHPYILFLVRHPAAVALSFWQMGWLAAPDVQLEVGDVVGDEWERFGFAYGVTLKNALEAVKRSGVSYKVIFYEDLANNPYSEFKNIFGYLQSEIPENYEDIIDEFCFSGTAVQGYQTRRVSKKMITKWKDKLSPVQVSNIQKGYLQSGLRFYQSDSDW